MLGRFDCGLVKNNCSIFVFSVGDKNVLRKRMRMFGVNQQCWNQRSVLGLCPHISAPTRCRAVSVRNRFTNGLGPIGIQFISRHIAFKPANRSPDVKGLYLAGGAAHPGPGMPMVLMSGWIAADALDADKIAPKGIKPPCCNCDATNFVTTRSRSAFTSSGVIL